MIFPKTDRSQTLLSLVSLIGAPLLWLIGTFVLLSNNGSSLNGSRLGMIGSILLIPAILTLTNLLKERFSNMTPWLGLLGIFGAASGINWSMLGMIDSLMVDVGVDAATAESILGAAENSLLVALHLSGIAVIGTMLIISILLWRNNQIPSWVALLLIVGAIVFPISWFVPILAYGTWGLWLCGLGWIGGQLWLQSANSNASHGQSVATATS